MTATGALSLCAACIAYFCLLAIGPQRSSAAVPTLLAMASLWAPRFFQVASHAAPFPSRRHQIQPYGHRICRTLAQSSPDLSALGLHGDCRGRVSFKSPVAIPASLRTGGAGSRPHATESASPVRGRSPPDPPAPLRQGSTEIVEAMPTSNHPSSIQPLSWQLVLGHVPLDPPPPLVVTRRRIRLPLLMPVDARSPLARFVGTFKGANSAISHCS
jgi:hypothetical protein